MSDAILAALITGGCALLVPLLAGVMNILILLWQENRKDNPPGTKTRPVKDAALGKGLSKISMTAGVAGFLLACGGAGLFVARNIESCDNADEYVASLHTSNNTKDITSKLRIRGFNVDADKQVLGGACRVEYFSDDSRGVASCAARAVSSWCGGVVEVNPVELKTPQPRRLGVWVK